ncbi:uncharacterized protein OCT59_011240 [Rhizophagus irregularis]|uniref:uncharacterized protein n=1 Tax=Rhizophagus irregularis TaxID=588596 RepID=UPI0033208D2C|nr:hypothetical protein OCT59_011240 [Rhizophagus irregularis]
MVLDSKEWLRTFISKVLGAKERLQTFILKVLDAKEQLWTFILKVLDAKEWLQTFISKVLGTEERLRTFILKVLTPKNGSGLLFQRSWMPKNSSGLLFRSSWMPKNGSELLFQRSRTLKAKESKNEFWTPISKIKKAENLDFHTKIKLELPYKEHDSLNAPEQNFEGFDTPRFSKWGRWASLDEPDLEIFSGFRRFMASGWNFEAPERKNLKFLRFRVKNFEKSNQLEQYPNH